MSKSVVYFLLLLVTAATPPPLLVESSDDTNRAYLPCSCTRVQISDGFTFGIAFAQRTSFLFNGTLQLSPCDRLALFRPKVDDISLLTINTSSFSPDSVGGYMVAFAGRKYAARSLPAFVAIGTYTVTSFTLARCLSLRKAGCKTCFGKGMVARSILENQILCASTNKIVQLIQTTVKIVEVLLIAVLVYS